MPKTPERGNSHGQQNSQVLQPSNGYTINTDRSGSSRNNDNTDSGYVQNGETVDWIKSYTFHNINLYGHSTDQMVGDCALCGGDRKFYVSKVTGMSDCKKCQYSGNVYTFLTKLHELSMESTTNAQYEELAHDRKLMDSSTLIHWKLAWSITSHEWIAPSYNQDGKLNNLYAFRLDRIKGKNRLYSTANLKQGLMGMHLYDPTKPKVYVVEALWNSMVLWEILGNSCYIKGQSGKISELKPGKKQLLDTASVLGVPGAETWNDKWNGLVAGKDVTIMYDSDHPRKNKQTGKLLGSAGYNGTRKVASSLLVSDSKPNSIKYLRWGTEGKPEYDEGLPNGYDIRDFFPESDDGTVVHRVNRLNELNSKIVDVPEVWKDEAKNDGPHIVKNVSPLACSNWGLMEQSWMRALQWRQTLSDVLATCLAVCLSTEQQGSQLFLQVIGQPGSAKCLGKGTPILMYDGTTKLVEDITVGDRVMGPDSLPKTVLGLGRGREMMYRVTPVKGDPYIVNESHILSLKITGGMSRPKWFKQMTDIKGKIRNMNTWVYHTLPQSEKVRYKGWRTGVDWEYKKVYIDPYFLGLWLGDGDSRNQTITTNDIEIKEYLEEYAKVNSMIITPQHKEGKCPRYRIVNITKGGTKNSLLEELRELGVINNKHIPHDFKVNCREIRLRLLAGLIDSDGYRDPRGCYTICTKLEQLANDILFLVRSLGCAAYVNKMIAKCQTGVSGEYFRITISGDLSDMPVKLERKKSGPRNQKKDVLVTGITTEPVGEDDYYGFEVDGDGLFLLGDFTVTHNTRLADAMLVSHHCFALEHLTGFHSGYKGEGDSKGKDYSLLARINKKTLITPEADVLMASPRYMEIMSQQRRIFDGTSGASYKNRDEDLRYTGLRTPWIMMGTPTLLDVDQSRLGDRFLKVIIDEPSLNEKRGILRRVGLNAISATRTRCNGDGSVVAEVLTKAYQYTGGYVNYLRENTDRLYSSLDINEDKLLDECELLADFTADMRARPCYDPKKVEATESKDFSSRLLEQLVKVAMSVTLVLGRRTIDDDIIRRVKKVALDTAYGKTLSLCRQVYNRSDKGATVESLGICINTDVTQVTKLVNFLSSPKIDVLEPFKSTQFEVRYKLTQRFKNLYERVVGMVEFI